MKGQKKMFNIKTIIVDDEPLARKGLAAITWFT